jgi:hypothetical protein
MAATSAANIAGALVIIPAGLHQVGSPTDQ